MAQFDLDRRFAGVSRIYGSQGLEAFKRSHMCIIGLGGVGSWVVEALARSAVGRLTLVDMDHVAESNINRQLQATDENLGKPKGIALKERIQSINPECEVNLIDAFIEADNEAEVLNQGYNWVIDCIDNFRVKASLIAYCKRHKIKVITVGGAGGMIDPSKIEITDLSRSKQDPLLSKTRKLLRQDYGFASNPSRRFSIPCVFSSEQLLYPNGEGEVTKQKPSGAAASGLNCAGGFGSSVVVTASFGFMAASYVLRKLSD